MTEDRMEDALQRHFARNAGDGASAARVMAKLAGPLPAQKRATPWWPIWPQILLDWQFAPAWPRMAALAGCAALGFVVGSATLDRFVAPTSADADLTVLAFEPEPLTGLRP
jgi:hypothetical protein